MFETLAKCWRPFTGEHYDLARKMCNYWTNFAKTGNPNGMDQDGTPLPEWRSSAPEEPFILFLGEKYIGKYENSITELTKFRMRYVFEKLLKQTKM